MFTLKLSFAEKNYGYKKPEIKDLLPFLIYRFVKATIIGIPQNIRNLKLKYEEFKEQKQLEEERAKELENIEVKGWLKGYPSE